MSASNVSARFLTARSSEELQQVLLAYQTKFSKQVRIITIYPEKNGDVTVWFYDNAQSIMEEKLNGGFKRESR